MSSGPTSEFNPASLSQLEPADALATVLRRAAELGASDLFLHTNQTFVEIAMRRLGTVERLAVVSRDQGRQLLSYIKAAAGMDIADHRRPADGRWQFENGEHRLDLRINFLATLFGEDVTLRIWDRTTGLRTLEQIGLTGSDLLQLRNILARPGGLLLVTGPTGTGKTTTLYACLQHLRNGSRKINTLEDPVEYAIEGVRQSQTFPKLGLDFPELLRHVLRQAPDVVMIGEIRDKETAITAVRAANSGHLVLATLHSPTAAGAVQSMLALGSQPHFLSSCLLAIVAQRLVRTLCEACRVSYDVSEAPHVFEEVRNQLRGSEGKTISGPGSCPKCLHTGYAGRTGIFEILTMNQELRRLVAQGAPTAEIQAAALRAGMIEFRRGALLKVAQGVTSTEEILRDVPAEHLGLD